MCICDEDMKKPPMGSTIAYIPLVALIEQEGYGKIESLRNIRRLRKLKFSTIFTNLPKFPNFSNLFITFVKKNGL